MLNLKNTVAYTNFNDIPHISKAYGGLQQYKRAQF